jgi:CRISPR-associated exonuclease Cas4
MTTLFWIALTSLALAVLAYIVLGRWGRAQRSRLGLAEGTLVAADDSRLRSPTLRSARLGLIGRPDHVLRSGRYLIPVEQKPRAQRIQPSHVMQVAAQCLLVQEVYGVRPPHGILVLADGWERVEFTPELERRLRSTMAEMRQWLRADVEPGPRWVSAKCARCAFSHACWHATN